MAVPRRILTVLVRSMTVFETGDRKVPEAQNSLNALLVYPVPGQAEVFATTGLIPGVEDNKLKRFNPPLLLLKEVVQGPTDIQFALTDRDDRNALVSFLRRVAGTVTGSAGAILSSELPGVFRAAFREAAASGQLAIGGAKEDKVDVVAVGQIHLRDADKVKGPVTVDLTAPRELKRAAKTAVKKGAPNGSLDLEILWDAD
ncbi:MAG: hypothetical protein ACREOU_11425 [Candidatus Eiseniibacteriota bacterium]